MIHQKYSDHRIIRQDETNCCQTCLSYNIDKLKCYSVDTAITKTPPVGVCKFHITEEGYTFKK